VAAHLAAAGKRCFAVDLDPQNALALHLGGSLLQWVQTGTHVRTQVGPVDNVGAGLMDLTLTAVGLAEYLRTQRAQVAHLPFGTHDLGLRKLAEQELLSDVRELRYRLTELSPPRCDFLLMDTPPGYNIWSEAALSLADLVIVPVLAQPACLAALPAYKSYLRECMAPSSLGRTRYVVNRWDSTRQLACDVFDVLAASMPGRVCPQAVHEDEQVREQLARATPLTLDSGSQAHADLAALAHYIGQVANETNGKPNEAQAG
jgi:cellulose biosynthesis protein BcsQ